MSFGLPDGLKNVSDILGFFLNVLQFVVIVSSVLAVLYLILGRFPRGLSKVFGANAITFVARFRVLWLCRRSKVAQRCFFEFVLVRGHGDVLSSRQWGDLVNDFSSFWDSTDKEHPLLEVADCTYFTSSGFSESVARYFDYLQTPSVASFYSINRSEDFWLTRIKVLEAYVMPAILLSGLLARYDENWTTFISRYISTLSCGSSKVLVTRELYNVFAWLLWGPSREIDWTGAWDGLCQISYGDESNSVPAVLGRNDGLVERMRVVLQSSRERQVFGALLSAEVDLEPKKLFFEENRSRLNPANSYFINKISNEDESSFVARICDFSPVNIYRSTNYYCTAYLWLLFERETEDGGEEFSPDHAVAFFEHANLADGDTCLFLTNTLVEKALTHFRMISRDEFLRKRRYRFICGQSRALEDFCRMRFAEEMSRGDEFSEWLKAAVSFDIRRRTNDVFAAIDSFFGDEEEYLKYSDLTPGNRLDMAELAVFYAGVYTDSFPLDDERETLPNILDYLATSRKTKAWRFHVLLAKNSNGVVVAGAVFDYFSRTNSVVVEFIAVDPHCRAQGVGSALYVQLLKVADADARACGHRKVDVIFLEAESPAVSEDPQLRHLRFWNRQWFRHLDFTYIQPALGPSLKPVHGLWFMACDRTGQAELSMSPDLVLKVVYDYIHYAMRHDRPEDDPSYRAMTAELARKDRVVLLPVEFD